MVRSCVCHVCQDSFITHSHVCHDSFSAKSALSAALRPCVPVNGACASRNSSSGDVLVRSANSIRRDCVSVCQSE